MSTRKPTSSNHLIPPATFTTCLADGLTLDQICKLYTRRDIHPDRANPIAYRLDKLVHHLKVAHSMTLIDYCRRYGVYEWPKCPIKAVDVGYRIDGKGVHVSTYAPGAIDTGLPANQASYERMRKVRRGEGNPMYGKRPWNEGLTAEGDERVAALIAKAVESRGEPTDEQREASRQRMLALIAERGPLHAMPHSEETKERCRVNTARLWAEGVFKRTSSIHLKMRAYLATLPLKQPVVEEHQVTWFSMDFAFPDAKVAIEVQGSYYHVDPRLYPDGPETAMQRRNWGRDIAKRKVCCDQQGWVIIEAWEPEINDGTFQHDIACKLRQYGLLD
jgi:hypothetical protein